MNRRSGNNTYAQIYNYNQQFPLTQTYNLPTKKKYYNSEYDSKHLLGGTEASGSVWVNNGYDIAKEDPGISWIL